MLSTSFRIIFRVLFVENEFLNIGLLTSANLFNFKLINLFFCSIQLAQLIYTIYWNIRRVGEQTDRHRKIDEKRKTHRETQRNKERHSETQRDTERYRETQRDTERYRETHLQRERVRKRERQTDRQT